jgi:hypothetical protein
MFSLMIEASSPAADTSATPSAGSLMRSLRYSSELISLLAHRASRQ